MANYDGDAAAERKTPARRENILRVKRGPLDTPFFLLVLILLTIGVITVLSASFASAYYDPNVSTPTYYFIRQCIFAALGVAGMLIISRIPTEIIRKYFGNYYRL